MCLLFNKHTPIRIATKDIAVYKLLDKWGDKTLHSPFWSYKKWVIGRKYSIPKLGIIHKKGSSFDGYDEVSAMSKWKPGCIWSVAEGFHSSKTKERIQDSSRYRIYKCIIPKGAEYITGIDGLMVSNQLKVIEEAK
jgi:hypothetical protein